MSTHPKEPVHTSTAKSFALSFAKPLGLAVAILAAFVGGMIWKEREFLSFGEDKSSVYNVPHPSVSEQYRKTIPTPFDYFPAAEFRTQSGLLVGCYDLIQADPKLFVDIAKGINGRLPVFGLVGNRQQLEFGINAMRDEGVPDGHFRFIIVPGNTAWLRDYAPFILRGRDNSVMMVDAKYQTEESREIRRQDEEMAMSLSSFLNLPVRSVPLVMEGGNLLSNGEGEIITTALTLAWNNHFGLSKDQVALMLREFLGVRQFTYVSPLENEPTGHADMFIAVLGRNLLVVSEADNAADAINAERLDKTAEVLSQTLTSLGPMKVHRIPSPPRLALKWRTYTNVVLANGILLMPSFSDVDPAIEDQAEAVYRKLLPGWEVKRINCDSLVKHEGYLRCITYHIPKYVSIERLNEVAEPKVGNSGNRSSNFQPKRKEPKEGS